MESVAMFPAPGVRTAWFSPENPQGKRFVGGTANGGRKGRPCVPIAAGESVMLAECAPEISGTLRRVWLTVDDRSPEILAGLRVQAWWDGANSPAIDAPLGDFFGQMCGQMSAWESVYFASPEGRSFVCTLPMPFRAGMRLILTNTTDRAIKYLYYDVNITTGETHASDTGYIHAVAHTEFPTTLQRDYALLPTIRGRGRYLGAHIGVRVDAERYGKTWWGEGEVKIYVDGDDDVASLVGTGTEDYIGTAWGQARFAQAHSGAPLDNDETRTYGFYRWHIPDPVWFHESVRVTIQQIGHCFGDGRRWLRDRVTTTGEPLYAAGLGLTPADLQDPVPANGVLFERADAWSSVAFFVLNTPEQVGF